MSVLLLLALRVAHAQDVPPPTVAPEAPAMPVETFTEMATWMGPRPPPDAGPLTGIAVAPDGTWLVGDIYGGVYRSVDRGRTWKVTLGALASPHMDKDLAQDAADRAKDAADEALDGGEVELDEIDADAGDALDGDDLVPDLEDARDAVEGDEGRSAADSAIDQAQDEGRRDAGADTPAYAWWHPLHAGMAFAGRTDGVYRSQDGGETWERVADNPGGHDVQLLGGELLVVAVDRGVIFTTDLGDTWIEVDVADGAHVAGLGVEADGLFAATDRGLFRTTNGLSWTPTALTGPVIAVVGDPSWTNGVWAMTEDGLQRSDDGGATFRNSGRQPMLGTRGLRAVGDPGHLLAWGKDGVWESVDAGVSWAPWTRGLRDPDVRGLAFADGQPVIAAPTGVWTSKAWRAPTTTTAHAPVSVELLIDAATRRQGLDVDTLSLGRIASVARLLPKLEVYADAKSWARRDDDYLLIETEESSNFEWRVGARFCFGGCASVVDVDYDDGYTAEYTYEGEDAPDVFVMDGDVITDDEPVLAAMKTARSIQNYRFTLVDRITDAWATHRRLLSQADSTNKSSLGARIDLALQLEEAEARLDLLTDGAFSRASLAPPESP